MQEEQIKLQDAFNKGFIPPDLREAMATRGHQGQVWVTEVQEYQKSIKVGEDEHGNPLYREEPSVRVGVGYKLSNDDGSEQNHIHWYSMEEVQAMLKDLNV